MAAEKHAAYVLLGPTASGKSTLAMEIAAKHPVEIVSIDSAQVYRGMDIGTAKPSEAERRAVPHHLIDILDPTEAYSAGRFREDAIRLVGEIAARNKVPLIVGGTMLYYRALAQGLDALPPANPAIRAQIDAEASAQGWPALHAQLAKVDPGTAARLKPSDAQRIQRALEVHHLTGKPLSTLQQRSGAPLALPVRLVGIALLPSERATLHQRIADRFEAMLATGLVEELKELKKTWGLRADLAAMRCVGDRQAWEYLAGDYDCPTLRDKGVFATRQLAKRQLTWLRAMPELQNFDCLAGNLEQQVLDHLRSASVL